MLLNLTGDKPVLDAVMEKAENFLLNGIPHSDSGTSQSPTPDFRSIDHPWIAAAREAQMTTNPLRDEGIAVSTQVAYVGEGGRIYDVGDTITGSVSVVSHYLTTGK